MANIISGLMAVFLAVMGFSNKALAADADAERKAILEELESLKKEVRSGNTGGGSGLKWGGYGEIHGTKTDAPGGDNVDLHRFVLMNTYDFADWINFTSELEIEHALVKKDSGGYLLFEQMHVDFKFSAPFNLRVGRVLSPLGHINSHHEPTTFNGVERSNFDRVILPSTWSLDGIGAFGSMGEAKYELYVTNGLDGSQFSETDGFRNGRMHEQPGISTPAVAGRVAYNIISGLTAGVSHYAGKANNGNKGINPKFDKNINVTVNAVDVQYGSRWVDVRGSWAEVNVGNVKSLNSALSACATPPCKVRNIASKMTGHSAEVGFHVMPEIMKSGKLKEASAQVFVRQDQYDTQAKVAEGERLKSANRNDLTYGLGFWPVKNLVLKLDHQVTKSKDKTKDAVKTTSGGIGWTFH